MISTPLVRIAILPAVTSAGVLSIAMLVTRTMLWNRGFLQYQFSKYVCLPFSYRDGSSQVKQSTGLQSIVHASGYDAILQSTMIVLNKDLFTYISLQELIALQKRHAYVQKTTLVMILVQKRELGRPDGRGRR